MHWMLKLYDHPNFKWSLTGDQSYLKSKKKSSLLLSPSFLFDFIHWSSSFLSHSSQSCLFPSLLCLDLVFLFLSDVCSLLLQKRCFLSHFTHRSEMSRVFSSLPLCMRCSLSHLYVAPPSHLQPLIGLHVYSLSPSRLQCALESFEMIMQIKLVNYLLAPPAGFDTSLNNFILTPVLLYRTQRAED